MKLFNAALSPNCLRVRAVIQELELDVELVDVSFADKPAELLALNPNGKVPTFVDDDGFSLYESRAINLYLATAKRPACGLLPSDPKARALVDQWSYWAAMQLGPAMQAVNFERVIKAKFGMGATDEANVAAKMKEIERYMPILDRGLEGKEWIVGTLTLADFAVAPSFSLRGPAGISLDAYPNVKAWIERLEGRPSWQRAVHPPI